MDCTYDLVTPDMTFATSGFTLTVFALQKHLDIGCLRMLSYNGLALP